MQNKYIVLCMLEGEAVLATSKQFDTISEALDYSATVADERYPMVFNVKELERLSK